MGSSKRDAASRQGKHGQRTRDIIPSGHPQPLRGRSEEPCKDRRDERPLGIISRVRLTLLLILPPILFFSYHPLLSLASTDSMNLELSLPLLWLALYDLISLAAFIPLIKSHGLRRSLSGISDGKFFLFSLFPLYLTASTIWSPNPLRALLTAGLAWALFFAIFATYQFLCLECCKNYNIFWSKFKKSLYLSTALACLFCWLQCFLDLAGLSREATLLCPGCTYQMFGFPHPSGFAIEPQFMGNLLLAPTIILLFDLINRRKSHLRTKLALALLFSTTIFLTFSRGAIFSFLLALVFISIITLIRTKSLSKILLPLATALVSFLLALLAQGTMAGISPTNDTFVTGVAKSLHQLTLGHLDLRSAELVENSPKSVEKPVENYVDNPVEKSEETASESPASAFDGYVAASTDIRLALTEYAVNLWYQSPANLLFGVGIGGAGTALSTAYPSEYSPKEIIQNQYASLALETGLAGMLLLALTIFLVLKKLHRLPHIQTPRQPSPLLFVSLCLAYTLSLCFFSGLTNALHIYLTLAIILIIILAPHQKAPR